MPTKNPDRKNKSQIREMLKEEIKNNDADVDVPENWDDTGERDRTLFHLTVQHGFLNLIDPQEITFERLLAEDEVGNNSYHFATVNNLLIDIPPEFITKEILLNKNTKIGEKCTLLKTCITYNQIHRLDPKYLTQEILEEGTIKKYAPNQENHFHCLAKENLLNIIPIELLNQKNLSKKNWEGQSPITISIEETTEEENIQIPKKIILDPDNLQDILKKMVDCKKNPSCLPIEFYIKNWKETETQKILERNPKLKEKVTKQIRRTRILSRTNILATNI